MLTHLATHTFDVPTALAACGGNDARGLNRLAHGPMVAFAIELTISEHQANAHLSDRRFDQRSQFRTVIIWPATRYLGKNRTPRHVNGDRPFEPMSLGKVWRSTPLTMHREGTGCTGQQPNGIDRNDGRHAVSGRSR